MEGERFTWGDTVVISASAPENYRPGELAEVCSIWEIKTEKNAIARGEPVGTFIYGVEFGDGKIMEIPKRYLEKYHE
ncbi:MAG: hypothetical protein U5R30_10600 [Deltaproteobacteria bacterium]|nr:hypothetical protein [Deltaproteobacteria bacterium]